MENPSGSQPGMKNSALEKTQQQVNEVVGIMRVNVEKVLERDQKLSELDSRADALQEGGKRFEQQAQKLKRKYWWKNLKMMIILGIIGVFILIIIIGVFLHLVNERKLSDKWEADSAAIGGWHVGSLPDHRARSTMAKHNIPYNNTARQIHRDDFLEYDYIFGMDENNISNLKDEASGVKNAKAQILLLGDFDPEGERIIRDPYYDNDSKGFEKCYQQCMRCCAAFLEKHS